MLDTKSFVVADFFQSRLGFGQDKTGHGLGFYHAFSSVRRGVSERPSPYHYQDLKIEYDRGAGTLKWFVDAKLVNTVTSIGVPTANMAKVVDLGGTTTKSVDPGGFLCGFGCFTLLDFSNPLDPNSKQGLVKLVNTPDFYLEPQLFVNPTSSASFRIWKGLGLLANRARFKINIINKKKPGKGKANTQVEGPSN